MKLKASQKRLMKCKLSFFLKYNFRIKFTTIFKDFEFAKQEKERERE